MLLLPLSIHVVRFFFFSFDMSALQDGQQYAKENNIIHLATSAKSGHNVKELFLEIGLLYVHTITSPVSSHPLYALTVQQSDFRKPR